MSYLQPDVLKVLDLKRDEAINKAREVLSMFAEQDRKAYVHFTFTCEKCEHRCTIAEENKLPNTAKCPNCGHTTKIKHAHFTLFLDAKPNPVDLK
jgi:predicted Zn-ribbon and HTH transcriptional regulator